MDNTLAYICVVAPLVSAAVVGLLYFVFASETGLRAGLWLNGIEGSYADDIVASERRRRRK